MKDKAKYWKEYILPKVIRQSFSPRIQKDLVSLKPPNFAEKLSSSYIHGQVNTGKTIYACQMLLELKRQAYIAGQGLEICFIKVSDLFSQLKDIYETKGSESTLLQKLKDVDALVLDDLGLEKNSEWAYQILFSLIDYRYEFMKFTIFTSNFSLDELADKLGDQRITSRIERMAQIQLIS